tara:strand:- start:260 stop:493 length:234 start_codon:yes stop_codon:yes gene_type:complete
MSSKGILDDSPALDKNDGLPAFGTMRIPIQCLFEPKEDITAFELAQLLFFMAPYSKPLFQEDWDRLGEMTRHLRRKE